MRGTLLCAIAGALLTGFVCRADDFKVSFQLVPKRIGAEEGGYKPSAVLKSGRVFLYGPGDYAPSHVLDANSVYPIPPGSWQWIAESDEGYVSVVSGTIKVAGEVEPGESPGPCHKTLVWPVVEACRIRLDSAAHWDAVTRLDIVSPQYSATFPVDPKKRDTLWVPAGGLLAYSVGRHGLIGIDGLGECSHREEKTIGPPAPPAGDKQEFLVHVTLPEDGGESTTDPTKLEMTFGSGTAYGTNAVASMWVDNRGSFFFLDVPSNVQELRVRHPELRTYLQPVESLSGSARELPSVPLKRRRSLDIAVDYQPQQRHWRQALEIFYCGRSAQATSYRQGSCGSSIQSLELEHGLKTYTFSGLDDGLYIISAEIDDEVVHGLGTGVFPYLDPDSENVPVLDPALLWEMHVYGSLLLDDEPVAGEVRLVPIQRGQAQRAAVTDDELLYHLYYFGRQPFSSFILEGDEDRKPEEKLGLYFFYSIHACDTGGACRLFHRGSFLRGSGRLDIPLGDGPGLAVHVADASTGDPVPGAQIFLAGAPGERLSFVHGDVSFEEPERENMTVLTSDQSGTVAFRDVPSGVHRVAARRRGYKEYRSKVDVPAVGTATAEIVLWPESKETKDGTLVRFADGTPLTDAFLLVIDAEGRRQRCSFTTDRRGIAAAAPGCVDTRDVVVLHPAAAIEVIRGDRFRRLKELVVRRAPPPLRVRVVDEEDAPLVGVPIELRFDSLTLGPNDFLMGYNRTQQLLFYRTGSDGFVVLNGVDPSAGAVPDVAAAYPGGPSVSVADYLPGSVVELVVPRGD